MCFVPTWVSSPTTAAWLVMSTVNISSGNSNDGETISGESGPVPCWLTTVRRSPEILLSSYSSDRQSEVASRSGLLSLHVWCTYFLNIRYVIQVYWHLAVSRTIWHEPLLCVQWKAPDDGKNNCPKHVEFYSKNKFEKLMHLVGFNIRIYHDARSPERQNTFTL